MDDVAVWPVTVAGPGIAARTCGYTVVLWGPNDTRSGFRVGWTRDEDDVTWFGRYPSAEGAVHRGFGSLPPHVRENVVVAVLVAMGRTRL